MPAAPCRAAAIGAVAAVLVAGVASVAPPVASDAAAAVTAAGRLGGIPRVAERRSVDEPYLTPDGQRVFFTSTADDLVAGDVNGVADVFAVRSRSPGRTIRSPAPRRSSACPTTLSAATRANGASSEPVASADGRYVAFTSIATQPRRRRSHRGSQEHLRARHAPRARRSASRAPRASPTATRTTPTSATTAATSSSRPRRRTSRPATRTARATSFARTSTRTPTGSSAISVVIAVPRRCSVLGAAPSRRGSAATAQRSCSPPHQDKARSRRSRRRGRPATSSSTRRCNRVRLRRGQVGYFAHHPTIDATGDTFAYIDEDDCDGEPAIVAGTIDSGSYYTALGTILTDSIASGYIADPVISADGSSVDVDDDGARSSTSAATRRSSTPRRSCERSRSPGGTRGSRPACAGLRRDWFDLGGGQPGRRSRRPRAPSRTARRRHSSPTRVFAMDTPLARGSLRHEHAGPISSRRGS